MILLDTDHVIVVAIAGLWFEPEDVNNKLVGQARDFVGDARPGSREAKLSLRFHLFSVAFREPAVTLLFQISRHSPHRLVRVGTRRAPKSPGGIARLRRSCFGRRPSHTFCRHPIAPATTRLAPI
jgi:hypothetical protein